MQIVEMQIAPGELPAQMAAMRNWLDEHHFEPSSFVWTGAAGSLAVSVAFAGSGAAVLFAARFAGRLRVRSELSGDAAARPAFELVG